MKNSTKSLLACAALAGLYSGALATRTYAVTSSDAGTKITKVAEADKDKASCTGKDGCKGQHDCKGKNDCKGQGGCKSANNDCKGKNECKGKGGCATAKKPADKSAPKSG